MNEDPIIAEIRRYRVEHTERYGHDLDRICEALREAEIRSGRKVVHRRPRLLLPGSPVNSSFKTERAG
jgi:hypothetical protein